MPEAHDTTPMPRPHQHSRWWWEAVSEGRLLLQSCRECEALQFYPRGHCLRCWSDQVDAVESTGTGRIHSLTVTHRNPDPALPDPYVYAVIQLDEGPRLTSRIVGEPTSLEVGTPVRVVFDEIDELSIPLFAPLGS
jgi:uncharacterized OB-fold protein